MLKTLTQMLQTMTVINLRPGELHLTQEPTMITTILGSCVAVCFYSKSFQAGAMCHGMLPYHKKGLTMQDPFRFVDSSVDYMVEEFTKKYKIPRTHFKAKIFGGANVLDSTTKLKRPEPTVGTQNIQAARESLQKHGVEVTVERVGGEKGYKLYFHSHSGVVFLRSVPIKH